MTMNSTLIKSGKNKIDGCLFLTIASIVNQCFSFIKILITGKNLTWEYIGEASIILLMYYDVTIKKK